MLEEYQGSTLTRIYNYGLSLINERAPNTSTNYFIYDGHGSTRLLADIGGGVVNAFAYDAYGNLIASNSSPQTLYLYCGQQFDPDLGQSYNRARYLNLNTGRFWTSDDQDGEQEDPLSLHKYFYAECSPSDNIDPDGKASFSSADSAAIGRQVHKIVEDNFTKNNTIAKRWTGSSIFTIAGVPNPVKKLGQKFGRIFPDLVDANTREIYEIKPATIAGTAMGFAQLYAYVTALNKLVPPATWHDGNSYDYKNAEGLGTIQLASPPSIIIVAPTVSGMIYYEAFTVQQLGNAGAKLTARLDSMRFQQILGASAILSTIGGIAL